MARLVLWCAIVFVLMAALGSGYFWMRSEAAMDRVEQSLLQLKTRADAADQQVLRLRKELTAMQPAGAAHNEIIPTTTAATPPVPSRVPPPEVPTGPVLTLAMHEVLLNIEQCAFAARTLRCTFNVTNQSTVEKKFILGVGGTTSKFEEEGGGTSVFDDVGNDFLSAGATVGNRSSGDCGHSWRACELEKTLSPNVRTEGFVSFDAVDERATMVKLLRVKWSDGEAWMPMDFRNIPITKLR